MSAEQKVDQILKTRLSRRKLIDIALFRGSEVGLAVTAWQGLKVIDQLIHAQINLDSAAGAAISRDNYARRMGANLYSHLSTETTPTPEMVQHQQVMEEQKLYFIEEAKKA